MTKNQLHINKLSLTDAHEISNWKYEDPYEIYSMDGSQEIIQSLLSEEYYAVLFDNNLFGYFCLGKEARVPGGFNIGLYENTTYTDLGLGMHPNFTGQGHGKKFLLTILKWSHEKRLISHFRLVVAFFNDRAIQLYKGVGFRETDIFTSPVGNTEVPFVAMTLSVSEDFLSQK